MFISPVVRIAILVVRELELDPHLAKRLRNSLLHAEEENPEGRARCAVGLGGR